MTPQSGEPLSVEMTGRIDEPVRFDQEPPIAVGVVSPPPLAVGVAPPPPLASGVAAQTIDARLAQLESVVSGLQSPTWVGAAIPVPPLEDQQMIRRTGVSTNAKIVIGIALVAVVIGGVFIYSRKTKPRRRRRR